MLKKYIGAGFVGLSLFAAAGVFAVPAHAASLTNTQISAIINLLSSFGADAIVIQKVEASLHGNVVPAPSCVLLYRDLTVGSYDSNGSNDVANLQRFLGISVTGYFGQLTSNAVQKWQTEHGIAITTPGVGAVGPKTRAALSCNSTPPSTQPWASIDQSSLTYTTDKDRALVTITGSASNTYVNGYGDVVVVEYSPLGGSGSTGGGYASVVNGRWQWSPSISLTTGTYAVTVKLAGSQTILTTGTLRINANGYANPTATIDQGSVTSSNNSFTLTGTAPNTSAVFVALVKGDYSGKLDWHTIYTNHNYVAFTGDVVTYVSNGRWSAQFSGVPSGTYAALVFNNNQAMAEPQSFLGSSIVTVFTPNPITFTAGSEVPLTLGVGQTATDGVVKITLTSVSLTNGTTGIPTATFRVEIPGFVTSYYTETINGSIGPFSDTSVVGGGIGISVAGISTSMNTARILVSLRPKG